MSPSSETIPIRIPYSVENVFPPMGKDVSSRGRLTFMPSEEDETLSMERGMRENSEETLL